MVDTVRLLVLSGLGLFLGCRPAPGHLTVSVRDRPFDSEQSCHVDHPPGHTEQWLHVRTDEHLELRRVDLHGPGARVRVSPTMQVRINRRRTNPGDSGQSLLRYRERHEVVDLSGTNVVSDVDPGDSASYLTAVPSWRRYRGTLRFVDGDGTRFARRVRFDAGPPTDCSAETTPESKAAYEVALAEQKTLDAERALWGMACAAVGVGSPRPLDAPTAYHQALGIEDPCNAFEWRAKLHDHPDEPSLYCVHALVLDRCRSDERALGQARGLTMEFPDQWRAWLGLAWRHYLPLRPPRDSPLPFNDELPPVVRRNHATQVIAALDRARALEPNGQELLEWTAMAYAQRAWARQRAEVSRSPADDLVRILGREDAMSSWRARRSICEQYGTGDDCEPPPFPPEEQARDTERKAELVAALSSMEFTDDSPRAIYQPIPTRSRFRHTNAAELGRRATVRALYCVRDDGRTEGVVVLEGFAGDLEVDSIIRDLVEQWRFRPARTDTAPRCTSASFDIDLRPDE